MSPTTCSGVPTTLKTWLLELVRSMPARSVATLLELLFGTLLTNRGMISQAILAIAPRRCWQAYYWFVERGRLPWIRLVRGLCAILERDFREPRRFLIIDDTLIFRTSPKAPDATLRYDHVRRMNRPRYVLCQGLVTLSASIVEACGRFRAVPLLSLPIKAAGNPGRLVMARALLGAIAAHFSSVAVLMDAWYMKRKLVLAALDLARTRQRDIVVIGQIRRDSALFRVPVLVAKRNRGRPRKYGARITKEVFDALPVRQNIMPVYGGEKPVRWCGISCRPHFLRGHDCRVVRVCMQNDGGDWSTERLLLSTDPTLDDEDIIMGYAQRWATEPLFGGLKYTEGFHEMWMQSRKVLLRWLHIVQTAAALAIMLSARADFELDALARIGGWRKQTRPSTPGLVKQALAAAFFNFPPVSLLGPFHPIKPQKPRPPSTPPPSSNLSA
jgi:DDE superfamily endonuclease